MLHHRWCLDQMGVAATFTLPVTTWHSAFETWWKTYELSFDLILFFSFREREGDKDDGKMIKAVLTRVPLLFICLNVNRRRQMGLPKFFSMSLSIVLDWLKRQKTKEKHHHPLRVLPRQTVCFPSCIVQVCSDIMHQCFHGDSLDFGSFRALPLWFDYSCNKRRKRIHGNHRIISCLQLFLPSWPMR